MVGEGGTDRDVEGEGGRTGWKGRREAQEGGMVGEGGTDRDVEGEGGREDWMEGA